VIGERRGGCRPGGKHSVASEGAPLCGDRLGAVNDADPQSPRGTHPYADSEGDTSADRATAGEPADRAGSSSGVAGAGEADGAAVTADTDAAGTADGTDGAAKATGPADTPTARRTARRRKRSWRSLLVELVILVVVALLLGAVIKTWAVQPFFIPSSSMEKTLDINDRVLVNKIVYDFRDIRRGDIVVFNGQGSWDPGTPPPSAESFPAFLDNLAGMFGLGSPGDVYVKRVIGLPGDRVTCCDAQRRVTVNGVPLSDSSYVYPGDVPSMIRFRIVVPAGHLWVMGDHRDVSDDSRGHLGDPGGGTVPSSAVIGRAFIIIWPPSRWRILPIPGTFSQPALSKQSASASASGGHGASELLGARLAPTAPILPWSLGFAGAVPLTVLPRRIRRRWVARRGRETA
jgi:signal peptidase I